jgi:hypothetical protein
MADVERNIYFYKVEVEDPDEWRRANALRDLEALTGENKMLDLGNDNYAWVKGIEPRIRVVTAPGFSTVLEAADPA